MLIDEIDIGIILVLSAFYMHKYLFVQSLQNTVAQSTRNLKNDFNVRVQKYVSFIERYSNPSPTRI
jgi:hypothetical protein